MKNSKAQKKLPATLSVDFTGVAEGSGGPPSSHLQEGDYLFKVVKALQKKKKDGDSRYISWQLKVEKGPSRGTLYHITTLKAEGLWSLRDFLSNLLGKEIPKKALNLNLDKYVGKLIGGTVEDDDPYEGKEKSKIVATFPASEYSEEAEDSDEEEAEEAVTSDDDEEEEESEDEEEDELDTDDL